MLTHRIPLFLPFFLYFSFQVFHILLDLLNLQICKTFGVLVLLSFRINKKISHLPTNLVYFGKNNILWEFQNKLIFNRFYLFLQLFQSVLGAFIVWLVFINLWFDLSFNK
jgi:type IV secretory pathway VirB6-like protein